MIARGGQKMNFAKIRIFIFGLVKKKCKIFFEILLHTAPPGKKFFELSQK